MAETMETHTPGPWTWGRGVEDDETRCFVTQGIKGRPPFLIAEIHNGAPGDCLETEEANARLIAAAPDLLAALKAITEGAYGNPGYPQVNRNIERMAEDAIAKAEGK